MTWETTWKRKLMALLLAAVSVLGVACGEGGEREEDNTEEMSEDD